MDKDSFNRAAAAVDQATEGFNAVTAAVIALRDLLIDKDIIDADEFVERYDIRLAEIREKQSRG